jgi:hypothetical protein
MATVALSGIITPTNVVTATSTTTLTNKTLTSPVLTTPALGTPASGVVTNLTGTASININGTVGATTPSTGAFTTLSATGVTTLQAGSAGIPALTTSGDTNTGIFFPAADTFSLTTGGSERMRFTSAGFVGINTTTPALRAQVNGTLGGPATSGTTQTGIMRLSQGSGSAIIDFGVRTSPDVTWIQSTDSNNLATNYPLCLNPNGGAVGIGTTDTSPAKLIVSGSGTAASIMTSTVARFNGSANGLNIGDDGTDAVIGVNSSSTNLGFLSRVAGVYTKTMVLTSAGYLLLGYTTSNGSYNLQVNSQIFATSATIATSDGRYKENVIPLSGALSLVNALNPVQFEWKKHPIHNFDRQQATVGFIAQEVQQVLVDKPYLNSIIKRNECTIPEEKDANGNVTKEAYVEEFLGIAEGNMIAILTKAIQEQQALIVSLKARLDAANL